jgi:hypothetical protein
MIGRGAVTGREKPIPTFRGWDHWKFLGSTHLPRVLWRIAPVRIWHRVFSGARRIKWFLSQSKGICLSEVCSLVPRIRYRFDKKLDSLGVEFGTNYQMHPSGHLERNKRTQCRIRDMQYWLSSHPWATLVDLSIYLEGWDRGGESQKEEIGSAYTAQKVQRLS